MCSSDLRKKVQDQTRQTVRNAHKNTQLGATDMKHTHASTGVGSKRENRKTKLERLATPPTPQTPKKNITRKKKEANQDTYLDLKVGACRVERRNIQSTQLGVVLTQPGKKKKKKKRPRQDQKSVA